MTYAGQNVVRQPGAPLYDAGYRLPGVRPRLTNTIRQPLYPLYDGWGLSGLGVNAPGILAASGAIAAKGVSTLITSAASSGAISSSVGALAGPIGAGVGILISVIAGLWSAHNARVAGAKQENQAINSAIQTWDAGMQAIFAAANSSDPTQNVSGAQAATQAQQLFSQFWAEMNQYMHAPGTADTSMGGTNCGSTTLNPAGACAGTPQGHQCDKSCTATCCVGCQDLYPSMLEAIQVLNSPTGGTVQVCAVASSSYGANARAGYTLTYSPPNISVAGAGASIVTDLTSGISSLFGGSTSGTSGTTGSLLPVIAIGALAFFLLR